MFFKKTIIFTACLVFVLIIIMSIIIIGLKISVPNIIRNESQNEVLKNITYKTVDGEKLKLDIYKPKRKIFNKAPVIFLFHGGSWKYGSKELDKDDKFLKPLLNIGIAVVSVDYRLTDETTVFPAHIEDCADSVRFIEKNADKYNFDKKRFCVMGASAGGHLTLLLALAGEKFAGDESDTGYPLPVKCAVSLCGPTDLVHLKGYTDKERDEIDELLEGFLGGTVDEKLNLYQKASPINYVNEDAPPIFISHGTKDRLVRFSQAENFYKAAKENNMNVTFVPVQNANHKFQGVNAKATPSIEEVLKKIIKFLFWNLIC